MQSSSQVLKSDLLKSTNKVIKFQNGTDRVKELSKAFCTLCEKTIQPMPSIANAACQGLDSQNVDDESTGLEDQTIFPAMLLRPATLLCISLKDKAAKTKMIWALQLCILRLCQRALSDCFEIKFLIT